MTIGEAISEVDTLQPSEFEDSQKIAWLDQLDRKVKRLIVDTCEGAQDVVFSGYSADTPEDTVLLVCDDFREIYRYWLCAQIDLHHREMERHNQMIELFNTVWDQFGAWYNRTHRPITVCRITL